MREYNKSTEECVADSYQEEFRKLIESGGGGKIPDQVSTLRARGYPRATSGLYASIAATAKEEVVVGDLDSELPGSGARKNSGKTPYDLIPVEILRVLWEPDLERFPTLKYLLALLEFWQHGQTDRIDTAVALLHQHARNCARVFEYGKRKYKAWNWAKGMPWSVPLGCILRHTRAILDGEAIDPESGESHYGHILCNVVMLSHYANYYNEGDDRPSQYCFGRRQEIVGEEEPQLTDYDNYAKMRSGQPYTNGAIGE